MHSTMEVDSIPAEMRVRNRKSERNHSMITIGEFQCLTTSFSYHL